MTQIVRCVPLLMIACMPRGEAANPEAPLVVAVDAEPASFADQRPADRAADPRKPDADGHHTVSMGTLHLDDEADVASPAALRSVVAEIEYNAGHLQRCYDTRAAEVTGLNGTISIHARITPEGRVDEQCIGENTTGDAELMACVNEVIAMGRYVLGQPQTVDVTVPFIFEPRSHPQG